jgi:hypothetical protein
LNTQHGNQQKSKDNRLHFQSNEQGRKVVCCSLNLQTFSKEIELQAQEKAQEMETTPKPWRQPIGRS